MLIEKDIKRVVHIHIPVQFVILSDYYWTWCFTDHHRFLLSRCLWLLLGFMHHQEKLMPSNPVSDFCVASFICLMIDVTEGGPRFGLEDYFALNCTLRSTYGSQEKRHTLRVKNCLYFDVKLFLDLMTNISRRYRFLMS